MRHTHHEDGTGSCSIRLVRSKTTHKQHIATNVFLYPYRMQNLVAARAEEMELLSRVWVFQYSQAMLRCVSRVRICVMGSFARVPSQEKQTLQVRRSVIRERRHKVWGYSGDDFVAS